MKEECIVSTLWMLLDFETALNLHWFTCTEIPEETSAKHVNFGNTKSPVIILNTYFRNYLFSC